MRYRADIDGLRAIAVLPVVLYHFDAPLVGGGYVGVDVFFVISGFLIGGLIWDEMKAGSFSIAGFYARRVRRIFPALFGVLALSTLYGAFALTPEQFKALCESALAAALFVPNVYFHLTSSYFAPAAHDTPLLHLWSLGVEEQFYLFFPLALMAISRFGRQWILIGLSVAIVGSFALSVILTPNHASAAFYLPATRAWELGAGAVLAIGGPWSPKSRAGREVLALAGLAAIVTAALVFNRSTPFPGYAAALPSLGAVAIIAAHARAPDTLTAKLLCSPPFVWFGLISYSLYLWHVPIYAFADGANQSPVMRAALFAAAIGAAWVSWRFIERPFRRRGAHTPALLGGLGAIAAGVAVCGTVVLKEGFPERLPESARAVIAEATAPDPRQVSCAVQGSLRVCRLGDAGREPDFVAFGDSHAFMLFPAFIEAAETAHQSGILVTAWGCTPLIGGEALTTGVDGPAACEQFTERWRGELRAAASAKTVFVVARWSNYYNFLDSVDGGPFQTQLATTLLELKNRNVYVLEPTPDQGKSPRETLAIALLRAAPPPDGVSVDEYVAQAAPIIEAFRDAGGDRIKLLSPRSELCFAGRCPVLRDGVLLYWDQTHLSRRGAQLLTPLLVSALAKSGAKALDQEPEIYGRY